MMRCGAGGPVGPLVWNSAALGLCGITTLPSACSYIIATGEMGGQQHPTHSKDLCYWWRAWIGSLLGSPNLGDALSPSRSPFFLHKVGTPSQGPTKHLPFWVVYIFYTLSPSLYINICHDDVYRSRLFILITEYISLYDVLHFIYPLLN